jgi:hypothetical protein
LKVVKIGRWILKGFDPVGAQPLFARSYCHTAAATTNDRVVSVQIEDGVSITSAVGIKPINRSGHRVKGHIPAYGADRLGLIKARDSRSRSGNAFFARDVACDFGFLTLTQFGDRPPGGKANRFRYLLN